MEASVLINPKWPFSRAFLLTARGRARKKKTNTETRNKSGVEIRELQVNNQQQPTTQQPRLTSHTAPVPNPRATDKFHDYKNAVYAAGIQPLRPEAVVTSIHPSPWSTFTLIFSPALTDICHDSSSAVKSCRTSPGNDPSANVSSAFSLDN